MIIDFSKRRFTKGYRSSLLLLQEKYDCTLYIYDILNLFLNDSYNTTWYCYDILIKVIKKTGNDDLIKTSQLLTTHLTKEKETEKRQYHNLLLKKVNSEIKERVNKGSPE